MTLPQNPYDGQFGIVRVGSGSDVSEVHLRWNSGRSKWVGFPWIGCQSGERAVPIQNSPYTTKQYIGIAGGLYYANDFMSPRFVHSLIAEGLALEYRHQAWLLGNGGHDINVGTYFYSNDHGEYNTPTGASSPGYTTPPSGGVAETSYLAGGSGGSRIFRKSEWATLGMLAGTMKDSLYSAQYGYMSSGATASGSIWDYSLFLRWVK